MGWLLRWRLRRAAKQYGQMLGAHLQRSYGASDFYTPVQIRASIGRLRLNERFVAIGYAAFLPEQDYTQLTPLMPVPVGYGEARALFERYRAGNSSSAAHHYESGLGVINLGDDRGSS